jgi:hypothetical protein
MKVKFHLPDFARLGKFNLMFKIMLERSPEFFREGVEIASVYGTFPPSAWNGGRLQPGNCNPDFVKNVVRIYENNNIPLRFTFTNPMIEEEHLSDEFCNYVLETAHNENNGCIVFSPVLEEYIRKNFPKYKITSSTCKRILDADTLYNELEKDYHLVVLDYDLNHRYDILEKIPNKEKIEILVNPCCTPACPNRSLHYKMLGMEQLIIANHVKNIRRFHIMQKNSKQIILRANLYSNVSAKTELYLIFRDFQLILLLTKYGINMFLWDLITSKLRGVHLTCLTLSSIICIIWLSLNAVIKQDSFCSEIL